MKTLKILLIIAFVMFSGSAMDAQNDENGPRKGQRFRFRLRVQCAYRKYSKFASSRTPVTDPLTGKILVPQLFLLGTATLSGHATILVIL